MVEADGVDLLPIASIITVNRCYSVIVILTQLLMHVLLLKV